MPVETSSVALSTTERSDSQLGQPRIVYVINSFDRGGAEAGLMTLIEGDTFNGCNLTVVALVRGTGGLENRLASLGRRPKILLDRRRMRHVDMPCLLLRLHRALILVQPHVVVASLPQANILARMSLLFSRQVRFISFEHNTHLAKRLYELAYRLTSSRVDWAFADAMSTLDQAMVRLYRKAPQRRTVVPLLNFMEPAQRVYRATCGPFHLVNAARFTTIKNQSALIEALGILLRKQRDVRLTLYGDGPERKACEALAARLGILDRVEFPGFVENWARRPADLFVLPSRHEGLCMVVLEAMHAGIPVLAHVTGGMRDYAASDLLRELDSIDPEAIADAICGVMADKAALISQARRAAEMVDRRFGASVVRQTCRDINKDLIAEVSLLQKREIEPGIAMLRL